MSFLVIINHSMAFLLELSVLAAVALFGYRLSDHAIARWIIPVILVAVVVVLWGRFAAPKAQTRLVMPNLLVFKIAIFAAGTAALVGAGQPVWALLFGLCVALHLALAIALDQL